MSIYPSAGQRGIGFFASAIGGMTNSISNTISSCSIGTRPDLAELFIEMVALDLVQISKGNKNNLSFLQILDLRPWVSVELACSFAPSSANNGYLNSSKVIQLVNLKTLFY